MNRGAGTHITEALVLRLANHGEADRVVTLLTASHGKVSAIAPGARRSRRRFGGALMPFGHGEATLRERRGQDLWVLEDLHCARGYGRLSQELGRYGHACYACELCLNLCPPGKPEPEVLALLCAFLEHLDGLPVSDKPRLEPLRAFELRLLAAVGLGLSLERCCACGGDEVVDGEARGVPFDPHRGGVLCVDCGDEDLGVPRLPGAVRAALLGLQRGPLGELAGPGAGLPPGVLSGCREVLLSLIRHHLGRDLRAVAFIAKLNLLSI